MMLLLSIPFFFLGLTISWVLTKHKDNITVLYGSNLLGSAIGAPLFIFIFNHFNGQSAIPICTLIMLLSSLILVKNRKELTIWSIFFVLIFPLSFFPDFFPMDPPPDKILGLVKNVEKETMYTDWSSLSKVDIVRDPDRTTYPAIGLWGISDRFYEKKLPFPDRHAIIIDSWAYTNLMKYPKDIKSMVFYDYMPTTFAFNLGNKINSSLHIGAGGGMDVYAAKYFGVPDVDGVEINPIIFKALRNEFSEYTGGVYNGKVKGLNLFLDEGRHFVEESKKSYDLIQLSGVDTFSSTQAGAFALSENNLYTVEAIQSYYRNISDGGLISMTRWFSPDESGNLRYSLRLLNLAREALEDMGVDPKMKVFYFVSKQYTILTIKKGNYTSEEIENGKNFINKNGFLPVITPGERVPTDTNSDKFLNADRSNYERFLKADRHTYEKLLDLYPYKVFAPTDDKPFFFELRKFKTLFSGRNSVVVPLSIFSGQAILFIILGELFILGILLLIVPLIILSRKNQIKPDGKSLLYFSLTGLAFMFVEIVFSQKLVLYLGHPTFSLSVVLFGMLFFSGIGSIVSGMLGKKIKIALILLPILLFIEIVTISPILNATLHLPFFMRILVTILLIGPIAALMGMPFPTWIKHTDKKEIPFLWGINGFFSVIASVLTILLSINFGFTTVFYIALFAYVIVAILAVKKVSEG